PLRDWHERTDARPVLLAKRMCHALRRGKLPRSPKVFSPEGKTSTWRKPLRPTTPRRGGAARTSWDCRRPAKPNKAAVPPRPTATKTNLNSDALALELLALAGEALRISVPRLAVLGN